MMLERSFRCLAREIRGAEGPVFDAHGYLFVVSPDRGEILRIDPRIGRAETWVAYDGTPAGLQLAPDDTLWVTDMKRGVLRVTDKRQVDPLIEHHQNQPIRGCNDGAFDTAGHFYFTAPAGSSAREPVGEVFCRRHDGQVFRIDGGYHFCNGIAVAADDRTLIVAETKVNRMLWAYDLVGPGRVGARRPFAQLGGDGPSGPDGIDFDAAGNLLSTNYSHDWLEVFSDEGELIEQITLPFSKASNIHFGGEDGRDLVITEHENHAVWLTRWRFPGLRLAQPHRADTRPENAVGHR